MDEEDLPEEEIEQLDESEDVIDTDDGGAIIRTKEPVKEPEGEGDFYENLAERLPESILSTLALDLVTRIEYDKQDRNPRDKQQAEGIKRTGLGNEAPGGASFPGASRVVHPMLAKGCVDFAARAIAEIMPSSGVVKDFIPGESTKARVEKAKRKVAYMNWQLKVQMPSFRSELEQLLTQLPLGGSQYLYLVWDRKRRKPCPTFWPIDDVILPYAATNFYTAERITMVERITEMEFNSRVNEGLYISSPETDSSSSTPPEQTESGKASDKIEGREQPVYNEDGLREVWKVFTYAQVESLDPEADLEDPQLEREYLPYTIDICPISNKILSLVRNWEEDDQQHEMMHWLIDFIFIPWRGALGVGLGQLIGTLAGASTGAVRALLDSAHVNNLPTLLKLKGANMSGQAIQVDATQVTEIEGGIAGDPDIRKLIMAIPFNPPSLVLLQLLGFLTQEAESVVRTTFEKLTETGKPDMPVGTTLALIEQGMKVLSAIHSRIYESMDRVLRVLHRINRMYVTDEEIKDDTGELLAKRSDFEGPFDVIPVSNPEVFSDVQRFAQLQMVAQRAATLPNLYNLRKVEELILERTKIPNATDLLLPAPEPQEMNAVNENMALSLGRPVAAFPEQDHLAHIQVLADFMQHPMFGQNPLIAPRYLPGALNHMVEHIVMWYVSETVEIVEEAMGGEEALTEAMKQKDPDTRKELDQTLAASSAIVLENANQRFSKLMPVLQGAMQMAQKYAQQNVPPDPMLMIEQMKEAGKEKDRQSKMATSQMKEQGDTSRTQMKEQGDDRRTQAEISSKEKMNLEDNLTALTIAQAEIDSGEKIKLETGTGIDPEADE